MKRPARRIAVSLALALAALAAAGTASVAATRALAPGERAPDLWGNRLDDGTALRLRYDGDRFTLVNFWATWCAPCREEMPSLQSLQDEHADRLRVVGVLIDSADDATAAEFLGALEVSYLNVRPNRKKLDEWGGLGVFPTTFLIGPDGTVVRRYVGATAEQIAGLEADVAAALAGRELPPLVMPGPSGAVTDADRPRPTSDDDDDE